MSWDAPVVIEKGDGTVQHVVKEGAPLWVRLPGGKAHRVVVVDDCDYPPASRYSLHCRKWRYASECQKVDPTTLAPEEFCKRCLGTSKPKPDKFDPRDVTILGGDPSL